MSMLVWGTICTLVVGIPLLIIFIRNDRAGHR